MKKLAVLIITILITSCTPSFKLAVKPYVVIDKYYYYGDKHIAQYVFYDALYDKYIFYAEREYYQIGDTIK